MRQAGAVAAGCARAEGISAGCADEFSGWLSEGWHGGMEWLERHARLRLTPESVFPGVRTVLCAAFPYAHQGGHGHAHIADYALGQDYHTVLRRRLQPVADEIFNRYGALSRICVDTAPLPERYWATMCGLGRPGRSGQLIVPGVGAGVFIATILTTLELSPDSPLADFDPCADCRACVDACPGHAIGPGRTIDARRCLSYLTIEHRGPWPDDAPRPRGRLYGCDICRRVCPHGGGQVEPLPEFTPRTELKSLTPETARDITSGEWRRLTRPKNSTSAMSRLPYAQLKETLKALFGSK